MGKYAVPEEIRKMRPAGTTVKILKITKKAVHARTSDGRDVYLDPEIVEIIH